MKAPVISIFFFFALAINKRSILALLYCFIAHLLDGSVSSALVSGETGSSCLIINVMINPLPAPNGRNFLDSNITSFSEELVYTASNDEHFS